MTGWNRGWWLVLLALLVVGLLAGCGSIPRVPVVPYEQPFTLIVVPF